MRTNFFANYKEFIIYPKEKEKEKEFDPKDYATHYILTLSLNDPSISNWEEANKYEIEIEKSIEQVLEAFNTSQKGIYHLLLLEIEDDQSYFVLSLSCKTKIESQEANDHVSYIMDRIVSNPFYVGQSWFRLVGDKARGERRLFNYSFKEYTVSESEKHT
ncbi:hypothetical protein [Bacillus sp. FJAT-50079]|uniref:hypothetical protein n=1 Tax=Bacillus sp. FJAT-50079 TaxID=2833577 RepID=UPI001BC931E7|nr:hypothetical protein [Bacillus sp. FJAT-50079]MBS4208048.1 hypothetical protein [Bacillus sp. FJAT-50079]